MTGLVLVAIVILVGAVVGLVALTRRRTSGDDGMASFRRHIDALSPEARREVIDRVRHARETGKGK